MMDWLVYLFKILGLATKYLLNATNILLIYLPIMVFSTGLYVYAIYTNYFKYLATNAENVDEDMISSNERIFFFVKMGVIILIGSLHYIFAFFLSTFQLLMVSRFLANAGNRGGRIAGSAATVLHWFVPIGLPLIAMAAGYMIGVLPASITSSAQQLVGSFSGISLGSILGVVGGVLGLIPALVGLFVYYYWGQKVSALPFKEYLRRYGLNIFLRIPSWLKYVVMTLFIAAPAIIITALFASGDNLVGDFRNLLYSWIDARVLVVDFLIIAISRVFYVSSFNIAYGRLSKRDATDLSASSFSPKHEKYFCLETLVMVIVGTAIAYLGILFAVYSLLIAAERFYSMAARNKSKVCPILAIAAIILAPVACILSIMVLGVAQATIPDCIAAAISVTYFLVSGRKVAALPAIELSGRFNRWFTKPVPRGIKYAFLCYIIGGSIFLIAGYGVNGVTSMETFMVQMRDGKKLATDVYYAPGIGKQPAPVILVRTPYDKDLFFADLYSAQYGARGYHVVVQDLRGTFASEGSQDMLLFTTDYIDGTDTIAWIMNQSWCNGKIASVGISALSINAYLYAGMNPPGLKCQSLSFGTPDLFGVAIMPGAFLAGLVENYLQFTAPVNWRYQLDYIFNHMATYNMSTIEFNATTLDCLPNTFGNVNVSALHVGGWYDMFLNGTIKGYMGYDKKGNTGARGHQLMVIGPWTHGTTGGGTAGEITYPRSSDGRTLIKNWESALFGEALDGIPMSWSGNRVAYYLMGDPSDPSANYWKFCKDWPLNYTWHKWYISKDGTGAEMLTNDTSTLLQRNISYLYDPRNPVLTSGGNNLGFGIGADSGPRDQRSVEQLANGTLRNDVLVFESKVLDKPYTIEGDLKAELHVKSSVNDTDFIVKLCDVYPDGRRMLIIDSALMTRLRNGISHPALMTPNQEYNITIGLYATAYKFAPGHKIAITITSSNYPRFAINTNNGSPVSDYYVGERVANNTIITGPNESCVYLPALTE